MRPRHCRHRAGEKSGYLFAIGLLDKKPVIPDDQHLLGGLGAARAGGDHEETPGRPQVSSHRIGGHGAARAGGDHEETPGRPQVSSHRLGEPGAARAGGAQ